MQDDFDSGPCPKVVRLFPLQDVVLFPHTILPLHIFEPRYREMTEDALADDKLIAIVRLRPGVAGASTVPAIEDVACLGEIVRHHRFPDGRFNLLLAGRRRIRLEREVPSAKRYRTAVVDPLEDRYGSAADEQLRSELMSLSRAFLETREPLDADLEWLWTSTLPLGVLTDVVAPVLGLRPGLRQTLLAESLVERRVDLLLGVLRDQLAAQARETDGPRMFPPLFSSN